MGEIAIVELYLVPAVPDADGVTASGAGSVAGDGRAGLARIDHDASTLLTDIVEVIVVGISDRDTRDELMPAGTGEVLRDVHRVVDLQIGWRLQIAEHEGA